MALRTALYNIHVQSGGKIVDFAGWDLPIQYTSPLEEHRWVRTHSGIFDISHMGRLDLQGPGIPEFLETFLTASILDLLPNQCRYSLAVDSQGRLLDDVYVFCKSPEHFVLVVNAANRSDVVSEWFQSIPLSIRFQDITETTAMIAFQGPETKILWSELFQSDLPDQRNLLLETNSHWIISRTGYTGEFGVEIILPATEAPALWKTLADHPNIKPTGLAARDSLRFEAGYMLFGHELTKDLYPSETNLSWSIRNDRLDSLPKIDCLDPSKARVRLIWFIMKDKAVPRQGYSVFNSIGQEIGRVSSGMYAPSLDGFYGNALVNRALVPALGDTISIEIRGTQKEAVRVKALSR